VCGYVRHDAGRCNGVDAGRCSGVDAGRCSGVDAGRCSGIVPTMTASANNCFLSLFLSLSVIVSISVSVSVGASVRSHVCPLPQAMPQPRMSLSAAIFVPASTSRGTCPTCGSSLSFWRHLA